MDSMNCTNLVPDRFDGPLCILLNAGSGRDDAATTRAIIEGVLRSAGREHHFELVEDADELPVAARRAVSRAVASGGVAVAAGGDGTINVLAQAALGSGCAFGVLPQGTFNYSSRAWNLPSDTEQATRLLLHARPYPVQVGLVSGHAFLVNASVGLYPKLLQDREAWKREYGRSRLVALGAGLATLLGGHRQLRLEIEYAGQTRAIRTATLFVGNNRIQLERLGIAEAGRLEDGELVAITPRPVGTAALLWLGLRAAFGRLGDAEPIDSFAFRRITVGFSRGRGRRPVKVAVDGEVLWLDAPLEFTVAPQPLFVLMPGRAA
jgi:diacylglycerol kinase family enzyme